MSRNVNVVARALGVLVVGLLMISDAALLYGQDAKRSYSMVENQTQNIDMGAQGSQTAEVTTSYALDLTQTGDNTFSVTVTDVTMEGNPMGNSALDPIIGLEAAVTLDAEGKIATVEGVDEHPGVTAMGGMDAFKDRMQSLFLRGPGTAMSVGSSWSNSTTLPSNQGGLELERVVDTSYSIVGEETVDGVDAWVVDVSSEIAMTGSGSQGGMTMDMEMQGATSGNMHVAKGGLYLLASEMGGDIEGTIEMAQGTILMTMEITNNVTSTAGM